MENADAEHATALALFHDIGEIRTGDSNWVTQFYIAKDDAEIKPLTAQIENLPQKEALHSLINEMISQKSKKL